MPKWLCCICLLMILLTSNDCIQHDAKNLHTKNIYLDAALGVALVLPATFSQAHMQQAWVLASDVMHTEAYASTVVLQYNKHNHTTLDEAWEIEFSQLATMPDFKWLSVDLTYIHNSLAIAYDTQFLCNDVLMHKTGFIFQHHDTLFDLSFNAPDNLFYKSWPMFDSIFNSIDLL